MSKEQIDQLSILERAKAPTPKIFRTLKIIGLTLGAAAGTLLTAPGLPAIVVTIASYIAVAGTVASAVSQITVDGQTE